MRISGFSAEIGLAPMRGRLPFFSLLSMMVDSCCCLMMVGMIDCACLAAASVFKLRIQFFLLITNTFFDVKLTFVKT